MGNLNDAINTTVHAFNRRPVQSVESAMNKTLPNQKSDMTKWPIMKHIEAILEITNNNGLNETLVTKCAPHADLLSDRLGISGMQAILLSVFVDQSDDSSIRMLDLARHFDCRNATILCYSDDIDALATKGYIIKRGASRHNNGNLTYRVPSDVIDALKKNKPYEVPPINGLSNEQLLARLADLFDAVGSNDLSIAEISDKAKAIIEANPDLKICKELSEPALFNGERFALILALFFCHKLANESERKVDMDDIRSLFYSRSDYATVLAGFKAESHTLFRLNLIEPYLEDGMAVKGYYRLTDEAKERFLPDLDVEVQTVKKSKDLLLAADITPKGLYYEKAEQDAIGRLISLLRAENFSEVQKRLSESGLRKGFACLFYGGPGTGKTETVYQIARLTGRDILAMNVEQIKSAWVGESEKNLKQFFNRYRTLSTHSSLAPILLFNEADALLGIRMEGAEQSADKMNNALQNIILQEMEQLDGIMIATTNLAENLDKAFERRFIYKIGFSKPGMETRRAIWLSMIPQLGDADATALANAYDFSGGQIENIARKCTVETILNGAAPTLSAIYEMCKAELIAKKSQRKAIGF